MAPCCWPAAPRASASPAHSRWLLHQPLMSGLHGQATDIDITPRPDAPARRLNEILRLAPGQPIDKINLDTERDFILEADEPRLRLVEQIICSRE